MERIIVPAREGRGARVRAGQRLRIVDVEGQQCADVWAFSAGDVSEYASAEHTRAQVARLFPHPGEHFVTNRRRPILLFQHDTSPGVHDMLIAVCDLERYRQLGVQGWHPNCLENLRQVMSAWGFAQFEVPQPINFFTNVPPQPDGTLVFLPALSRPGDSVQLRAEMDCYLVVSASPQDMIQINAEEPTSLALELLD